MKKINFIIALSLLCCSYESMGLGRRAMHSINQTPDAQSHIVAHNQRNVLANAPVYVQRQVANRLFNNVDLPSVRITERLVGNKMLHGNRFALIEVTDLNGQNIRASCGYNALHTNRRDVYNALVAIFHPKRWTEDIHDEDTRMVLSRMLRAVTGDDEHVDNEYHPQEEWNTINSFFQNKIRDGGAVMDQNLALLVCYIRGENLAVVNQDHIGEPIINNPNGITRYLYNPGGHWQELRPYNQQ